jgi:hypothetical protein
MQRFGFDKFAGIADRGIAAAAADMTLLRGAEPV